MSKKRQKVEVRPDYVYKGNSIGYIYQKMERYRDDVGKVCDMLQEAGFVFDGEKSCFDHLRTLLDERARIVHLKDVQRIDRMAYTHSNIPRAEILEYIKRQFTQRVAKEVAEKMLYKLEEVSGVYEDRLTFTIDIIKPK